jgi:hypothetical protein
MKFEKIISIELSYEELKTAVIDFLVSRDDVPLTYLSFMRENGWELDTCGAGVVVMVDGTFPDDPESYRSQETSSCCRPCCDNDDELDLRCEEEREDLDQDNDIPKPDSIFHF